VAVGAGASIATETVQLAIEEREEPAEDGFARLAGAGSRMLERCWFAGIYGRGHQQRRYDEKESAAHMLFLPLRLALSSQGNLAARRAEIMGGSMKNPDLLCS
jgi:hypothetical protein